MINCFFLLDRTFMADVTRCASQNMIIILTATVAARDFVYKIDDSRSTSFLTAAVPKKTENRWWSRSWRTFPPRCYPQQTGEEKQHLCLQAYMENVSSEVLPTTNRRRKTTSLSPSLHEMLGDVILDTCKTSQESLIGPESFDIFSVKQERREITNSRM